MKKYWLLTVVFLSALFVSIFIIQLVHANEAPEISVTSYQKQPSLNPTYYIRKLTETPLRLTGKPTVDPTHYILRLSGTPSALKPSSTEASISHNKDTLRNRLTERKLQMCLSLSNSITKRSQYLVSSSSEMMTKFKSILENVTAYYLGKLVPRGIRLEGYETLTDDIAAKQKIAESYVANVQTSGSAFSCTGENPSEQIGQFHMDVKAAVDALTNYRASIKNLISAIQRVSKITPSPTVSP